MSKENNLTDFLTDIADTIRTKKGTSGTIDPQDFSSEIASISGGGVETMTGTISGGDIQSLSFADVPTEPKCISLIRTIQYGISTGCIFAYMYVQGQGGVSFRTSTNNSTSWIRSDTDVTFTYDAQTKVLTITTSTSGVRFLSTFNYCLAF